MSVHNLRRRQPQNIFALAAKWYRISIWLISTSDPKSEMDRMESDEEEEEVVIHLTSANPQVKGRRIEEEKPFPSPAHINRIEERKNSRHPGL